MEAVGASSTALAETPARDLAPDNPLLALERIHRTFRQPGAGTRRGGRVTEVSATHFRVRGLSESTRLGDIVQFRSEHGTRSGEIVQIGVEDVIVAPYETCDEVVLNQPVYVDRSVAVVPDESWRGRAVDALGRPIDDRGPVLRGNAEGMAPATPSPLARQRVIDRRHRCTGNDRPFEDQRRDAVGMLQRHQQTNACAGVRPDDVYARHIQTIQQPDDVRQMLSVAVGRIGRGRLRQGPCRSRRRARPCGQDADLVLGHMEREQIQQIVVAGGGSHREAAHVGNLARQILDLPEPGDVAEQLLDGVGLGQLLQRANMDFERAHAICAHLGHHCRSGHRRGCKSRLRRKHDGLRRHGRRLAGRQLADTAHQIMGGDRLALPARLMARQQAARGIGRLQQHVHHGRDQPQLMAAQAVEQ